MKSQTSISSLAFALSLISTITAIPSPRTLEARQDCTGVSSVVVGEYCTTVDGPGTDPVETICQAYILQLDNLSNIIGNGSIGYATNLGSQNTSAFCEDYDLVTGSKAVEIESCDDDSWIYTLENCVDGTSIEIIQSVDGTTASTTATYDTSITLANDFDEEWYNKFVADESAF